MREILPRLKQCENGSLSSSQNCPKDREKKANSIRELTLKAVDLWGNASELSEVRSIILGGAPPMPPEFELENLNADGADRVRVSIDKVTKDIYGENTDVVKYKIYRSQFHIPNMVVHTLVDETPSDDSIESFEWIDPGVIRHRKYYYTVVAVDDNGNESERPDVKSIEVGDDVLR